MYEWVLAAALLMQPPCDLSEPIPEGIEFLPVVESVTDLENFKYRAETIQKLAIDLEILDPREVRYVLARPEDKNSDLNLLRKRRTELRNAPFVIDGMRFPNRATVNEVLAYNRTYRQQMDNRSYATSWQMWQLKLAVQETDQLYQIWDMVRDANCEYYYVTVRRDALRRLMEAIGEDDYYEGRLPPYVPLWRFQEIR